jgi:hypothetical protein
MSVGNKGLYQGPAECAGRSGDENVHPCTSILFIHYDFVCVDTTALGGEETNHEHPDAEGQRQHTGVQQDAIPVHDKREAATDQGRESAVLS